MTEDEIRAAVLSVLSEIAPEVDGSELADDEPLRDQVDLDSMDWLRFLGGLQERTGVEVSEADYGILNTLLDVIRYVGERVPRAQ